MDVENILYKLQEHGLVKLNKVSGDYFLENLQVKD